MTSTVARPPGGIVTNTLASPVSGVAGTHFVISDPLVQKAQAAADKAAAALSKKQAVAAKKAAAAAKKASKAANGSQSRKNTSQLVSGNQDRAAAKKAAKASNSGGSTNVTKPATPPPNTEPTAMSSSPVGAPRPDETADASDALDHTPNSGPKATLPPPPHVSSGLYKAPNGVSTPGVSSADDLPTPPQPAGGPKTRTHSVVRGSQLAVAPSSPPGVIDVAGGGRRLISHGGSGHGVAGGRVGASGGTGGSVHGGASNGAGGTVASGVAADGSGESGSSGRTTSFGSHGGPVPGGGSGSHASGHPGKTPKAPHVPKAPAEPKAPKDPNAPPGGAAHGGGGGGGGRVGPGGALHKPVAPGVDGIAAGENLRKFAEDALKIPPAGGVMYPGGSVVKPQPIMSPTQIAIMKKQLEQSDKALAAAFANDPAKKQLEQSDKAMAAAFANTPRTGDRPDDRSKDRTFGPSGMFQATDSGGNALIGNG